MKSQGKALVEDCSRGNTDKWASMADRSVCLEQQKSKVGFGLGHSHSKGHGGLGSLLL